jgi:hypothetical protein
VPSNSLKSTLPLPRPTTLPVAVKDEIHSGIRQGFFGLIHHVYSDNRHNFFH